MTLYYARALDEKGRCCGRKPLVYKRDRYRFCTRCCSAFDIDEGRQIQNWMWKLSNGHFFPKYEDSESVTKFSAEFAVGKR